MMVFILFFLVVPGGDVLLNTGFSQPNVGY